MVRIITALIFALLAMPAFADPDSDARAAVAVSLVGKTPNIAKTTRTAACPCGEKCVCKECKCKGYFRYFTKRVKKCDGTKCWYETVIQRERVKDSPKKKKPVKKTSLAPVRCVGSA